MQILLIGAGAREDALAWKIQNSSLFDQGQGKLYTWPKAYSLIKGTQKLDLAANARLEQLADKALELKIDLTICGPEAPLADGIKEAFEDKGLKLFGPSKGAAKLESSKVFAKNLMKEAQIPTADFLVAGDRGECFSYAKEFFEEDGKVVLKADGLASGKGVFVCQSIKEIEEGLDSLYSNSFSHACDKVLVERCLLGRECSHFTIINKHTESFLGFAVDFKRAFSGDKGPNTGGMGCYTPVPWLPANAHSLVMDQVIVPLKNALKNKGMSYEGFLYVGLMWTDSGPMVIEFNVRLGDPEAQVLAVYDSKDWLELIMRESIQHDKPVSDGASKAVAVVMASNHYPYPSKPSQEKETIPLSTLIEKPETQVFAAAVAAGLEGEVTPLAGRVFTVVAKSPSFSGAREQALSHCQKISKFWTASRWREDIAQLAAEEEC
ncbi:MAG: phosphoribosylamine--glycine ligase [Oligoflexales bacterium]|nr:phosphoribosylamine--glycine ligase [Oligoflexales bacterium]